MILYIGDNRKIADNISRSASCRHGLNVLSLRNNFKHYLEEYIPDYVILSDRIPEFKEISDFISSKTDSRLIITGNSRKDDHIVPGAARIECRETWEKFQEIVETIEKISPQEQNDTRQYRFLKQEVISFYSVQGGTGKTSVAFNLARRFTDRDMGKVLVLDLNFCEGPSDMHLALGMRGPRSLGDIAEAMLEGEDDAWKETGIFDGVNILCPPLSLYRGEKFTIEMLADLVYSARNEYDLIIADLPFRYDNISLEMINISTTSVLVMSQDTGMIQRIKAFNKFIPDRQKKLAVLNRAGSTRRLTADELEDMTGLRLCQTIPLISEEKKKYVTSGDKPTGLIDLQDRIDNLMDRIF